MKRHSVLIFLLFPIFFPTALYGQNSLFSVDEAIDVFNGGDPVAARQMLEQNLQTDSEHAESRLILGLILERMGKYQRALRTWEEGLRGSQDDYPFFMSMGSLHMRLSETLDYDFAPDTSSGDAPSPHLEKAAASFNAAAELYPYEVKPSEELIDVYKALNKPDSSLFFARRLADMYPQRPEYRVEQAYIFFREGKIKEAKAEAKAALNIDNRFPEAYFILQEICSEEGLSEEAEDYLRKGSFYSGVPPFTDLEYSEESFDIFTSLAGKSVFSPIQPSYDPDALIQELTEEVSPKSSCFLAMVAGRGEEYRDKTIEELLNRDLYALRLLHLIVEYTDDRILIRKIIHRLAELKKPGTFTLLSSLLSDERTLHSVRVAQAMATLGDRRAVPFLIRELNPKSKGFKASENKTRREQQLRARSQAALALSSFDNPVVRLALTQGLDNSEIRAFCAASLFRITGEDSFLKPIALMARSGKKNLLLGNFLKNLSSAKAHRLARKLSF